MSNGNLHIFNKKQILDLKENIKEFKIPYRSTLGLPDSITFGCEIEFSIPEYNKEYKNKLYKENYYNTISEFMISIDAPKIWKYEDEHSDQIEVISDVLTDNEQTWKTLNEVLLFYVNKGAYVDEKSSAHIHIGKKILNGNLDNWLNFFKLFSIFEKQIVRFTNGERYYKRECFSTYSNWSSGVLKKVIYDMEHKKYEEKLGLLSDKSCSIRIPPTGAIVKDLFNILKNEKEFSINDTIEIRCPNGTLNKVIWQNNINFFLKMLFACSSNDLDTELISYLYRNLVLRNHKSNINMEFLLCDMVFNNDFDKKCFLRQYYKDFDIPGKEDPTLKSKPFWK